MQSSPTTARVPITEWDDAERYADRLVPGLSPSADARHHELLARRLLAAAAWWAAAAGDGSVTSGDLAAAVGPELDVLPGGGQPRPLDGCADPRVAAAVGAVRRRGRAWTAVAGPERNCAAWIALAALGVTDRRQQVTTTTTDRG